MRILFISRAALRCGVVDYGKRLFSILQKEFDIHYREVLSARDFIQAFDEIRPDIVLYNYYCSILPFITDELLKTRRGAKHIVIYHEASIDFTPDATIGTLPRPVYEIELPPSRSNDVMTVGSFGFGFADKNFQGIAELVKSQYSKAIIKLNIPFAEFGDDNGASARTEAKKVQDVLKGTDIQLIIDHSFLSPQDLIMSLNQNDINLFLYSPMVGRGYSSAIDYALSARKPIGLSDSYMFRHLPDEMRVTHKSIETLVREGVPPKVYEDNSHEKVLETYRNLFSKTLNNI